RRRRHAVDARGVADGARLMRDEFLLGLVRQPRQRRIIEVFRQREAFIAAIRFDIAVLPRQIDVVLGIDLDLLGDLGRERAELRPDLRQRLDRDLRIRQQLEGRTAVAVFVERKTVLLALFRRQRNGIGEFARGFQRR
ncbi:MAG: hypothetical protein JWQ83_5, partial [Lacunisphaera sp.]|nr:hypothetical protein [Lacunisphaera sp.]